MANENHLPPSNSEGFSPPLSSEQIQATAPLGGGLAVAPAPERIPLPPPDPAPSLERIEGVHVFFDAILAVLVLVLTFLLGSIAATNSDLWMTLATGKMISQGEYQFGVDPFSFTTHAPGQTQPNTVWINHQWLSSWILYQIYALFGGTVGMGGAALVVFKAVALVGLAWLLLRMRVSSQSRGWVLGVVTMAMLALSTRVLLQPMTFSFVLLGVMFYLLYRGGALGGLSQTETASTGALWCVPILAAAWVNLDSWFILAPITVSLLALGAGIGALIGVKSPLPRNSWLALTALTWLACLINPHHFWGVVTLPPELAYLICQIYGEGASDLASGGTFLDGGITLQGLDRWEPTNILMSPLNTSYITTTGLGWNWAGVAFFSLVVFSLATFLIQAAASKKEGAPGFPMGRLLVWVFFGALGLAMARLIPLFAVAGAVLSIRNLDEWLVWRTVPADQRLNPLNYTLARSFRWCGLALLLVMLFLAWPGWLHLPFGNFSSIRRVAWQANPDPSLQLAAERIKEIQADQKGLAVFNFSPDLANYCAWFAPGVQCYFDSRYGLFARQAEDYHLLRQQIIDRKSPKAPTIHWTQLFTDYGIGHVAMTNFNTDGQASLMARRGWADPLNWREEYGDGKTLVFARGAARETQSQKYLRQAFGPVPSAERAPPEGPQIPNPDRNFWDQYLEGIAPPALSSLRSVMHVFQHGDMAQQYQRDRVRFMQLVQIDQLATFFAPVGLAPASPQLNLNPICILMIHSLLSPAHNVESTRAYFPDVGPPALPLLAVRHARRAVQDNPYHYTSYLALSNAYRCLRGNQEDFWLNQPGKKSPSLRTSLRQIQEVAALNAYLELNPENSQAQFDLAELYKQQHFLDAGLEHAKLALKYFVAKPPDRRQEKDTLEFKERVAMMESQIKDMERDIKKRRYDFENLSAGNNDLGRCELALFKPYSILNADNKRSIDPRGMGLALEALKILENIPYETMTNKETIQVAEMQVHLLLNLGRINEVAKVMPSLKTLFTDSKNRIQPQYFQYRVLLAGAQGNYVEFDKALEEWENQFNLNALYKQFLDNIGAANMLSGLSQVPLIVRGPQMVFQGDLLITAADIYQKGASQWCSLHALRGFMALEHGDTAAAAQLLRECLNKQINFPDRPIALRYRQLLDEFHPGSKTN